MGHTADNTAPFGELDDELTTCLQFKVKDEHTPISPWLWLLLMLVLGLAGMWGYHTYQAHKKWAGFVEALRQEPGIVVTQAVRRIGAIRLSGLRDPLAAEPLALLAKAGFDPGQASGRWETYYALEPAFVLERARQGLKPPESVGLELVDGTLRMNGSAPHAWIESARRLAPLIPGVRAVASDGLRSTESLELQTVIEHIEAIAILFTRGTTAISREQYARVERAADLLRRIQALAPRIDRDLRILIVGHTDNTGDEAFNRELSYQRADKVWRALTRMGVSPRYLSVRGMGASDPLRTESTEEERERNRRVSFRVFPVIR